MLKEKTVFDVIFSLSFWFFWQGQIWKFVKNWGKISVIGGGELITGIFVQYAGHRQRLINIKSGVHSLLLENYGEVMIFTHFVLISLSLTLIQRNTRRL